MDLHPSKRRVVSEALGRSLMVCVHYRLETPEPPFEKLRVKTKVTVRVTRSSRAAQGHCRNQALLISIGSINLRKRRDLGSLQCVGRMRWFERDPTHRGRLKFRPCCERDASVASQHCQAPSATLLFVYRESTMKTTSMRPRPLALLVRSKNAM